MPERAFPKHQQYIRSKACVVPGCASRNIICAHVRSGLPKGEQAGTGQKPHDTFTVPLCRSHHDEQHSLGEITFQKQHKIDLLKLSLLYASGSPESKIWRKANLIKLQMRA